MKKSRHYKYISIKRLISIAKIFNSIFSTRRKKRGRALKYSDEVIGVIYLAHSAKQG